MYVQSDTLFLADIFENVRNTSLEIYEVEPARFCTAALILLFMGESKSSSLSPPGEKR